MSEPPPSQPDFWTILAAIVGIVAIVVAVPPNKGVPATILVVASAYVVVRRRRSPTDASRDVRLLVAAFMAAGAGVVLFLVLIVSGPPREAGSTAKNSPSTSTGAPHPPPSSNDESPAPPVTAQPTNTASAKNLADGQIEGGNIFRVSVNSRTFGDQLEALVGRSVTFKFCVSNPGPVDLVDVRLRTVFPRRAGPSSSIQAIAGAANAFPTTTTDTATLYYANSRSACLHVVPRSTRLLDASSKVVRPLPEGISKAGVVIGDVGVPLDEIRFVVFRAVSTAASTDARCPS